MNPKFESKVKEVSDLRMLRQIMEESGIAGDSVDELDWDIGTAPFEDEAVAAKARDRLWNRAASAWIAKTLFPPRVRVGAHVPKERGVALGLSAPYGDGLVVDRDEMGQVVVIGMPGMGKTSFLIWLAIQLVLMGIRILFHDVKGEGRRLLSQVPGTMVCGPGQGMENDLHPIGDPETYWTALFAELARAYPLHAETFNEAMPILKRITRGLKPGQPYPSWRDLARILRRIAKEEHRPKLLTLAGAIESLCALLGKSALLRRGPSLEGRYPVTVFEHQQLPPRLHRFQTAVRLLRMLSGAMSRGHGAEFRIGILSDEAPMEFGKEFSTTVGSGHVPINNRIIREGRSYGLRILAGTQTLSLLDDGLKSCATTVVCFRCPDPREAREAQQLLMLPCDAVQQIMTLPVGSMFVRSAGFPHAIRSTFPKLELGPYPSDADLAARLAPEVAWMEQNSIFAPADAEEAASPSYLDILDETAAPETASQPNPTPSRQFFAEHLDLLRDVAEHPDASVTQHYARLGWSAGRGNRVKAQLLEMGLAICTRQSSTTGRPRELLVLTTKGKEVLRASS
jgi:hypothetical protein